MDLGIAVHPSPSADNAVLDLVERARLARSAGITGLWLAQLPTTEALSLAPLLGFAVPGLSVGTSVVTMNPRHPLVVATQSRIAQAATDGRFTLGLGLGSPGLEARAYDIDDRRRIARLEEYLAVLTQARQPGPVAHEGALFTARADAPMISGGDDFPILVAAMGPRALRVAARQADGVLPNLVGPKTLEQYLLPSLMAEADAAGRPRPRVVAAVAAVVTAQPDQVRRRARHELAHYGQIPSYRAMLDREGVEHPADVALIGSAEQVTDGLGRLVEAGADALIVTQTDLAGPQERDLTWTTLGALSG